MQTRDHLAQQFEFFASDIGCLTRQSRNIAARSRQTRDDAGADRIASRREHDRNGRCRLLCCKRRWSVVGKDDIDFQPNELVCEPGQTLGMSFSPTILDRKIAALDPAQFAHSLNKRGSPCALCGRCARA